MTAKVLHLRPEALDRPSALDLIELEVMMLWPEDSASRERARDSMAVCRGVDMANAGLLSPETVRGLANLAAQSVPVALLREDAKQRYERGLYAGRILMKAVSRGATGNNSSLGPIMDELKLSYTGRRSTASKVVNNEVWKPFRPVSHLWATHVFYLQRGHQDWPCARHRLALFLAIAEAFRVTAEGVKSNAKSPRKGILEPGEAVTLAPEVMAKLPKGRLKFEAIH